MNEKDPAAYDLLTYAWVFLLSLMGGVVAFLQNGESRRRRLSKRTGDAVAATK